MDKTRKHEISIYCLLWGIVFIVPTLTHYVQSVLSNDAMDWMVMHRMWQNMLLFSALFWAHDVFIAPLLFDSKRRKSYILWAITAILLYSTIQITILGGFHPPNEGMLPPDVGLRYGMPPPRPTLINPQSIILILIAITMCAANIGIKYYFKARRDEALNMEREKQSLSKEIEFLTYQISPHFFMNTLNNIHALIDIDPEKAKATIIELSRMMRYALYECRAETVPLRKEVEFLNHYIALMRLRYTDNVDIQASFSHVEKQAVVPPLLFVTFVENAFKHGISYRSASYVHVSISESGDTLTFKCVNSVPQKSNAEKRGIGLKNVKDRLRLIYGTGFSLTIDNSGGAFSVLLTIPTNHDD